MALFSYFVAKHPFSLSLFFSVFLSHILSFNFFSGCPKSKSCTIIMRGGAEQVRPCEEWEQLCLFP
jgi:hypothetical protein